MTVPAGIVLGMLVTASVGVTNGISTSGPLMLPFGAAGLYAWPLNLLD